MARTEIERLRAEPGFPDTLTKSVRAVGTTEGAAVMQVPPSRFTRLAKLGLVVPVSFYLNRYRAVVWLYLADELRQFAADKDNVTLLTGRTPEGMRDQLAAGVDLRPGTGAGATSDSCCGRPKGPGSGREPWPRSWTRSGSPRSPGTPTNAPT